MYTKLTIAIYLVVTINLLGCADKQSSNKSMEGKLDSILHQNQQLQTRIDSLQVEQQKLKSKQQTQSTVTTTSEQDNPSDNNSSNFGQMYAFVVLEVTYKYFDTRYTNDYRREKYFVTSKIKSFSNWNEDTKYQFMDDFQSGVSKDYSYDKTNSRNCYSFSSYKEASKARAKYVTSEE